jgi:hypothetical protein
MSKQKVKAKTCRKRKVKIGKYGLQGETLREWKDYQLFHYLETKEKINPGDIKLKFTFHPT